MGLKEVYDLIRKEVERSHPPETSGPSVGATMTAELQLFTAILLVAAILRWAAPGGRSPIAVILLAVAAIAASVVMPLIVDFEKENSSELNMLLFWMLLYGAVIIAIGLWRV